MLRRFLLLCLLSSAVGPLSAAVTYGGFTTTATTTAKSMTVTATLGATGANTGLFVIIDAAANYGTPIKVDYNGTSLTSLGGKITYSATQTIYREVFYLIGNLSSGLNLHVFSATVGTDLGNNNGNAWQVRYFTYGGVSGLGTTSVNNTNFVTGSGSTPVTVAFNFTPSASGSTIVQYFAGAGNTCLNTYTFAKGTLRKALTNNGLGGPAIASAMSDYSPPTNATYSLSQSFNPNFCGESAYGWGIELLAVPPTPTPTATPSASPTASPTVTGTDSPTASPTASPTGTPSITDTASPTSSPTDTPTDSPSPTATPTGTETPSVTASPVSLLGTVYHLVSSAVAAVPAGALMQPAGTGASGNTPNVLLSASPVYWYTDSLTGYMPAGDYTATLWTDDVGASQVSVELGYANPNGTAYVPLATQVIDTSLSGSGDHATQVNFGTLANLGLNDKSLRLSITWLSGGQPTLYYNGGVDFDSRLGAPNVEATATPTASPSVTPSITETWTPTETPTESPSATPTGTPSHSPTDTPTVTPSATPSITPTDSPTRTATATYTATPSASPTRTTTPTATITRTATATSTPNVQAVWVVDGSIAVSPSTAVAGNSITVSFNLIGSQANLQVGYLVALRSGAACGTTPSAAAGTDILVSESGVNVLRSGPANVSNGRQKVPAIAAYTPYSVSSIEGGSPLVLTVPAGYATGTYSLLVATNYFNIFMNPNLGVANGNWSCVTFNVTAPTPTATRTATPTRSPTATATPSASPTPTASPSATATASPTASPSSTDTDTPTQTATDSPTPTETPSTTPTETGSMTPSQTDSDTPTGTPTETPTSTFEGTDTETPTDTPTSTETPSASLTATDTDTPTVTGTETPSSTDTDSPTVSPSMSPTGTGSMTPSQTDTDSPTATTTDTPTDTPTSTGTPSSTGTPTETEMASPSATDSVTPTVTESATDTDTPTETASATPTATDSATPTVSDTDTPTATASETPTDTPTSTGTVSSTDTPTETETASPSATGTETPTVTESATDTETPTESVTSTPTATDSATPTVSPSMTTTGTGSMTPSQTDTDTPTATATETPTDTPTSTGTVSSTDTPTETETASPSATGTETPTATESATDTETPTDTPTATPTATDTETPTDTPTATATATESATPSVTLTATESVTLTATPSATESVTFTATPSETPVLSATSTATPQVGILSGNGGELLAPVPIKSGGSLVLYGSGPLRATHWEVYRVDLRKVAELDFGSQANPAWDTSGSAAGIYFVRVKADYQDGSSHTAVHKVVVLP